MKLTIGWYIERLDYSMHLDRFYSCTKIMLGTTRMQFSPSRIGTKNSRNLYRRKFGKKNLGKKKRNLVKRKRKKWKTFGGMTGINIKRKSGYYRIISSFGLCWRLGVSIFSHLLKLGLGFLSRNLISSISIFAS